MEGDQSSVKKTVRWTVFSGDRRILRSTQNEVCIYASQNSRRIPPGPPKQKKSLLRLFLFWCSYVKGGIRSSVKKTVRGTVFSGDQRFLQGTYFKICTYALQDHACRNGITPSMSAPGPGFPENEPVEFLGVHGMSL